jgi:hypothetical protein
VAACQTAKTVTRWTLGWFAGTAAVAGTGATAGRAGDVTAVGVSGGEVGKSSVALKKLVNHRGGWAPCPVCGGFAINRVICIALPDGKRLDETVSHLAETPPPPPELPPPRPPR